MEEQNKVSFGSEALVVFLGGAMLGVGAALLLAPKSGRETRSSLRGYAQKIEDDVEARVKDITSTIEACQRMCKEHLMLCQEQMKREGAKSCCS